MAEDAWKSQLEALGQLMRAQRKLAKLSLRELASLTSLSNAYLSQLERGLHEPSIRVLNSIASAFGLPPEVLLGQAGLLTDEPSGQGGPERTKAAILADERLSASQKEALLAVYRSFAAGGNTDAESEPGSSA